MRKQHFEGVVLTKLARIVQRRAACRVSDVHLSAILQQKANDLGVTIGSIEDGKEKRRLVFVGVACFRINYFFQVLQILRSFSNSFSMSVETL